MADEVSLGSKTAKPDSVEKSAYEGNTTC